MYSPYHNNHEGDRVPSGPPATQGGTCHAHHKVVSRSGCPCLGGAESSVRTSSAAMLVCHQCCASRGVQAPACSQLSSKRANPSASAGRCSGAFARHIMIALSRQAGTSQLILFEGATGAF